MTYNEVINKRADYRQALKEFINEHYDELPNNLSWNDYTLLFSMMGRKDWYEIPDEDKADSEFVKEELHGMRTYLYHKEEGCYI